MKGLQQTPEKFAADTRVLNTEAQNSRWLSATIMAWPCTLLASAACQPGWHGGC
jgi:hypothetical protein